MTRWVQGTAVVLLVLTSSCGAETSDTIGRVVGCDAAFTNTDGECSPGRTVPVTCADNRPAADLACDTEDSIGKLGYQVDGSSYCTRACLTDQDCGDTGVCSCGPNVGACYSATCRTNDDCIEGASCISWTDPCGAQLRRFACTTDEDTCHNTGHCPDGTTCSGSSGSFHCEPKPDPCYVQ